MPTGNVILSVSHENLEEPIMTNDREIENGRFNVQGIYQDGIQKSIELIV